MVDQQPAPRRRKRTQFLGSAYERCMSTRIAVVRRITVLILILASSAFITGRRPWIGNVYNKKENVSHNEKANELLQALYDLELPKSRSELTTMNEELAHLDPTFILRWAHHVVSIPQHLRHETHNHTLVQVTSFGPTGLVILDQLSQMQLLKGVPVITLDTLHLFKESYAFYDTIKHHYDIKLKITKPIDEVGEIKSRNEFDEKYAGLWKADPKRYTKLTKQDPVERVFDEWGVKMWITGRRRSQGGERSNLQILEFEYNDEITIDTGDTLTSSKGKWKLNPLAYWTYDQVWNYIRERKIPYNSLYDKGYTSLGDEMTTRLPDMTLKNDESAFERSGRFVGLNQTECGLHSHRAKINAKKNEAQAAGEEWKAPTLPCDKCVDLDVNSFEDFILNEKSDILLEFFSPYCGSCQEFAPTMERLAEQLSSIDISMKVARFDITEHDPPLIDNKKFFEVEATPTLYQVRHSPFMVKLFEGEHDYHTILRWLQNNAV